MRHGVGGGPGWSPAGRLAGPVCVQFLSRPRQGLYAVAPGGRGGGGGWGRERACVRLAWGALSGRRGQGADRLPAGAQRPNGPRQPPTRLDGRLWRAFSPRVPPAPIPGPADRAVLLRPVGPEEIRTAPIPHTHTKTLHPAPLPRSPNRHASSPSVRRFRTRIRICCSARGGGGRGPWAAKTGGQDARRTADGRMPSPRGLPRPRANSCGPAGVVSAPDRRPPSARAQLATCRRPRPETCGRPEGKSRRKPLLRKEPPFRSDEVGLDGGRPGPKWRAFLRMVGRCRGQL